MSLHVHMYCTAPETQQTAASPSLIGACPPRFAPLEKEKQTLRLQRCLEREKGGIGGGTGLSFLLWSSGAGWGRRSFQSVLRTHYVMQMLHTTCIGVAAPPARYGVPCSVRRRPKDTSYGHAVSAGQGVAKCPELVIRCELCPVLPRQNLHACLKLTFSLLPSTVHNASEWHDGTWGITRAGRSTRGAHVQARFHVPSPLIYRARRAHQRHARPARRAARQFTHHQSWPEASRGWDGRRARRRCYWVSRSPRHPLPCAG